MYICVCFALVRQKLDLTIDIKISTKIYQPTSIASKLAASTLDFQNTVNCVKIIYLGYCSSEDCNLDSELDFIL